MANAGSPHSNGSQFSITLDRCDWLGSIPCLVTGDTIYNILRLGEIETDVNGRPLDPRPEILSVEVQWNPFEDIVPRMLPKPQMQATIDTESKNSRKKAVKKLNLLSFGEEAEEEEKELASVKQKIKSSHDVMNDPRLLKEVTPDNGLSSSGGKSTRDVKLFVRDALSSKKEESQQDPDVGNLNSPDYSDED